MVSIFECQLFYDISLCFLRKTLKNHSCVTDETTGLSLSTSSLQIRQICLPSILDSVDMGHAVP